MKSLPSAPDPSHEINDARAIIRFDPAEAPAITQRASVLPPILSSAGGDAITRFAEFFAVNIRNPHTRRAYLRNSLEFLCWCDERGISSLKQISPMSVAAYIESLQKSHSKPTVKQKLAAVRMLFDWLVLGQIVPSNPAHAVRGPKYQVTKGKTPVLTPEETRALLESIPTSRVVATDAEGNETRTPDIAGLRDRGLIAAMFFTFARVSAVLAMTVQDYYPEGKRYWFRLHEKGGKEHTLPVHHTLEEYLDAYLQAAGIADDKKGPLFRSLTTTGNALTSNPLSPADVWRMIRRRAKAAGINSRIGCHSFRATGITNYLQNRGTLEKAQQMAAHSSPRTTKLYDRSNDEVTLDEIEKITL